MNNKEASLNKLAMYFDIYKHHFELFLKGLLVYLTFLGVIIGLITSDKMTFDFKLYMALLAYIISTMAMIFCVLVRYWVINFAKIVRAQEYFLKMDHFPFWGAQGFVIFIQYVCLLFAGIAVYLMKSF